MYSLVQIEEKVKKIVMDCLELDPNTQNIEIEEEFFLDTYGFTSIDALDLLMTIESEFDIEVEDEKLNSSLVKSLKTLSEYVYEKVQQK